MIGRRTFLTLLGLAPVAAAVAQTAERIPACDTVSRTDAWESAMAEYMHSKQLMDRQLENNIRQIKAEREWQEGLHQQSLRPSADVYDLRGRKWIEIS